MQRNTSMFERLQLTCLECGADLLLLKVSTTCKKCNNIEEILRCSADACNFPNRVCATCYMNSLKTENSRCTLPRTTIRVKKRQFNFEKENSPTRNNIFYKGFIIFFTALAIWSALHYSNRSEVVKNVDVDVLIKELKELYPSQRSETWSHFFSVLEKKPSVKSLTLLHNEDKTTSGCLVTKLVSLFSNGRNINIKEITFTGDRFEGLDYGFALKHFHAVVKKFGVFTANLTEVPGKYARIFHSLCDEVSSDLKPSLFIFTLKCDNKSENLKPLEKATTILQKAWGDLQSNELFPLLSRVLKNVVEIMPETNCPCCSQRDIV